MDKDLIPIGLVAKKLGVTPATLRRWDKNGKLRSIKQPSGRYYYDAIEIDLISKDIYTFAKKWITAEHPENINNSYFCVDNAIFQTRLQKLERELQEIDALKNDFSFITSIVGEIGNNSFDHNLGSWPDVRGILFMYDLKKRQIVLADRGHGILSTLKRVRPKLKNDKEALLMAFTEKISGRAPENRGNGLKYVKRVIIEDSKKIFIKLVFQTGQATLNLKYGDSILDIKNTTQSLRGCLAFISF